jgi:hypothetical protein
MGVCRPAAEAARRAWRVAASLPGALWRWRTTALEGLCAATALGVLASLAWRPAATALGWLAGSAVGLANAALGLLG